jgi:hypothetical protein
LSAAEQRYWDGEAWTNHVHGGRAEPERRVKTTPRDRPRALVGFGAVALAISPLLSWVNVVLLGSLNLFQLSQAAGHSRGLAWSAVLVGGASALGAWTASTRSRLRLIGAVVGLGAGLVAVLALVNMVHDVRQAHGLARVSYGPWVAIFGCVAMVVGGWMSKAAKPEST